MLQIIDNTLQRQDGLQGVTFDGGEANIASQQINLRDGSNGAPINVFGGFKIEAVAEATPALIANRSTRILNVNGQLGLYYNLNGVITRLFVFGNVPI